MKSLTPLLLDKIRAVILSYKPAEKIIIFGSRANGNFRGASDIDIAILDKSWADRDINIVKNKLDEEVKTALKFDVLNFYSLAKENLKEKILKEGKIIYDAKQN